VYEGGKTPVRKKEVSRAVDGGRGRQRLEVASAISFLPREKQLGMRRTALYYRKEKGKTDKGFSGKQQMDGKEAKEKERATATG